MIDRNSFMETLRSVAELRRTSVDPLSKEDILKYFEGMELTEEHKELIYQYMLLPIEVQTAEPEPETEVEEEEISQPEISETEEEATNYFQMYLDDLSEIQELSEEEMEAAYKKLLEGDASVIGVISESWLQTIAQMAIPYAEQGANIEDVIQEGNMGLLLKLTELVGAGDISGMDAILEGSVAAAMMAYTEENLENQVADLLMKEERK